ncbi:GNAT family N-acetyltransferase [Vallitalea guaymasensis]|uniref:GNAT family N-acetyltransferase n=1 Tax=Vallitalea guaymasensis TaxID=1185412 RepID=UPI002F40448A
MEYVKIKGKRYGYVVDFKDDNKIRNSFNKLTRNIYGFDFEKWYQNGYWNDRYIPYALLDDERVIANASVNIIDFLLMGKKKRYIQIGTVMTDEEYRNQGLNRFIIEKILDEWKEQCDLIYLFANDSVVDFYPKFGFVSIDEYQHSKKILPQNKKTHAEKLNMSDKKDRDFLVDTIKNSMPVSKLNMVNNESLIMFYCTSFMKDNIYYIEELDTIVVAEFDGDTIYLNDVFSIREIHLNNIIDAMINKDINKIVFGFTPKDTIIYDVDLLKEEDTTLFVMRDNIDIFGDRQLMFPLLSHA